MRVMGGLVLCCAARTRCTPLLLTSIFSSFCHADRVGKIDQDAVGMHRRIRESLDRRAERYLDAQIVLGCATVTFCTVAGPAVFCAAAQDNKSIRVATCF